MYVGMEGRSKRKGKEEGKEEGGGNRQTEIEKHTSQVQRAERSSLVCNEFFFLFLLKLQIIVYYGYMLILVSRIYTCDILIMEKITMLDACLPTVL